ncbi:MAG TPA: histidine kinase dimerization/phosphoacceptor domain -containing protein [Ignavibacteriaceae bacterium]|nr:histidine kinase dimerization/phosphoacceptor domain -containing protein [Ignavibacteriaceae bacterium]
MKRFRFSNYSIEKRLPIFIFSLLFVSLVVFISYSYFTVRNNSLAAGYERLNTLTQQFSSIFSLQAKNLVSITGQAAQSDPVLNFLINPDDKNKETLDNYNEIKFKYDSLTQAVQLWSKNKKLLYSTNENISFSNISDSSFRIAASPPGYSIGKLSSKGDTVIFPMIISVSEHNRLYGYVVRWRMIHATKAAIEQLAHLIGRNANILVGNKDSSLWTNLRIIINDPRLNASRTEHALEYVSLRGDRVIAEENPIPGTPWICIVELSKDLILKDTSAFLKWVVIFGIILIIIGLAVTWILSRNITKPLNTLSMAAAKIADGNYFSRIELNRTDELGILANSFNEMSARIRNSKDELEKKINEVEEKNEQLENSLKEKEILLKEVHHRVKNNLQIISSLLNLQANNLDNPEIRETFKSSQLRIRSIALIHEKLYKSKSLASINLKEYINELVVYLLNLYNTNSARIGTRLELDDVSAEIGTTITLGLIVSELVTNAIKYAFPDTESGNILISLKKDHDACYTLMIKDNGKGLPENFNVENAQTLGLSIVKTLLTQIDGEVEYRRTGGTEVRIYFKIPAGEPEDEMTYLTRSL